VILVMDRSYGVL